MMKRVWKKRYLLIFLMWLQIGAVTVWNCRTVWKFQIAEKSGNSSKKLKIELPYYPAIPLLGISLDKTIIQKDTCILVFIAAVLRIAKMWKQPKYLLANEWVKKIQYVYIHIHTSSLSIHSSRFVIHTCIDTCIYCIYTYNGILFSHEREWNNAVCSNMDGPRDYHTVWSRERQKSYSTYMWN